MSDEQTQNKKFKQPTRAHSTKSNVLADYLKKQDQNTFPINQETNINLSNIVDNIKEAFLEDSNSDDDLKAKQTNLERLKAENSLNNKKPGKSFDRLSKKRISINTIYNIEEVLKKLEVEGVATVKRKVNRSHTLKKVTIKNSIIAIYSDTPKPMHTPNASNKSILKVNQKCENSKQNKQSQSFITLLLQMIDFKSIIKAFGVTVGSFIIAYLIFRKVKL
jgi:hypothetical protein